MRKEGLILGDDVFGGFGRESQPYEGDGQT